MKLVQHAVAWFKKTTQFFTVDPVSGEPTAITRSRAIVYLVASIVAVGIGMAIYALETTDTKLFHGKRPRHGLQIAKTELAGSHQSWRVLGPLHADAVRTAVHWDFVFIAGYGLAFLFAMLLAHSVFWSPRARKIARGARWLALAAVLADIVENIALLSADSRHKWWLDVATAAAEIKFSSFLVAATVSIAALFLTARRFLRNTPGHLRDRKTIGVRPTTPVTSDDPRPSQSSEKSQPSATGADRWKRGYFVPGVDPDGQTVGICLSGGGVRSASVALGTLQALRDQLKRARYLVSVSGGGYTAGAFQLAMTDAGDRRPDAQGTPVHDAEQVFVPGSVEEDWVRRHADYLADSPAKLIVALGVAARVLLLSIAMLFVPAIVLGLVVGRALSAAPLAQWNPHALKPWDHRLVYPPIRTGTWYAIGALAALALGAYLWMLWTRNTGRRDAFRGLAKGFTSLAFVVAVIAIGIPSLVYGASWVLRRQSGPVAVGGSIGTVLLSYGVTLVGVGRNKKVRDKVGGLFKRGGTLGAAPAGAVHLVLVGITLLLLGAGWLLLFGGVASVAHTRDFAMSACVWVVTPLLLAAAYLFDQTSLSLHPFYRRQLAGAFAVRRVERDGNTIAEGYDYHEMTKLSTYGARPQHDGEPVGFPEVIFAATANLTGEERAPLNGVPFTFSAEWVGGPDIGYIRTADLEERLEGERAFKVSSDLTVEAAVAISGAAFSSAMGRANRWYGTLLAVTGMRLGTWLPNPVFVEKWNAAYAEDNWTLPTIPRIRRLPYLVREVLGLHQFSDRFLQVTDGGHYENLGLVELMRRRCTEIYCIDASGDSPPTATTLEQALTIAHAELGVTVELHDSADHQRMWDLVPGSGTAIDPKSAFKSLNARLTKEAVVVATITYPEESGLPGERKGVLIFAKTFITPDMDYEVMSYAARTDIFPRDSTGDQFFDDGKFCAYRALGEELGKRANACAQDLAKFNPPPQPSGSGLSDLLEDFVEAVEEIAEFLEGDR